MIITVQLTNTERADMLDTASKHAADTMLENSLLTRKQAAKILGASVSTLNKIPVKRAKIAGLTRYRMQDLIAYAESVLEQ